MSLLITPETKVGALLDAYPGIEEHLIAWVPAFSKLKNPILRKTVARVATLEQAARIGGIGARELVRKLREATGQEAIPETACMEGPSPAGAPTWLADDRVAAEIDADAMLETGEHPIGKVRQTVANLRTGEILRLTSSFRPAPLIDTMARGGVAVYSAEIAPGRYATYFCRP
ncbi:MAG TPA: DUF1858 domain-containing protein [Bryobacteraceae bacterium]|nr:DUF1858 domain-containing protein [Bryobacteraceae bacterium]